MSELIWWPRLGYGRQLPDSSNVVHYDNNYFDRCKAQESTRVGQLLIGRRCDMAYIHCHQKVVVDIGVGALGFINARSIAHPITRGYDVNPKAIEELKKAELFVDMTTTQVDAACFWDSLEHMISPEAMLKNVRKTVLMSIPIFDSAEHVIKSKHYKPGEHIWYFTEAGLIRWMNEQSFGLIERNRDEERYGREGIGSYVFSRI